MELKIEPETLPWTEGRVKNFFGKDLIQLKNGGLKLVKVAAGAVYPVHQHPDKTEYAYVLDGRPAFRIDEMVYQGSTGDFFIFPSKVRHAIINESSSECLLLVGAIMNEHQSQ